tara:strand:- start:7527 stop:8009 length:483 start_codon:yes stop_codon:yes gene_type:complete
MSYPNTGMNQDHITCFQGATAEKRAAQGALQMTMTRKPGFPCRISVEDAEVWEELILFHCMSHDVDSPYGSSYVIFARTGLAAAAQFTRFTNVVPPVFESRPLGMRAFGINAMLKAASHALPGEADRSIRQLFELNELAYIDVHNAAHGCFVARVERFES